MRNSPREYITDQTKSSHEGRNQPDAMQSFQRGSPPSVTITEGSLPVPPLNNNQGSTSDIRGKKPLVSAHSPFSIRDKGSMKFVRAASFPRAACDACHNQCHECSFISFRNGCQWCRRWGYECRVNQIRVATLWKRYDEQYPVKAESLRRTEEMLAFFFFLERLQMTINTDEW